MANWISKSIAASTGVTDVAEIDRIADIMASNCQALSTLSPEQFYQLANEACELVQHLKTPAGQAGWTNLLIRFGIEDWPSLAPQSYRTELSLEVKVSQ